MQVAGLPRGRETRVLFFPEFAPNPNPNYYCHVDRISNPNEQEIDLLISQGFGSEVFDKPYAHVQLNAALRVMHVQPGARLAELLETRTGHKVRSPAERAALFAEAIGDVSELTR